LQRQVIGDLAVMKQNWQSFSKRLRIFFDKFDIKYTFYCMTGNVYALLTSRRKKNVVFHNSHEQKNAEKIFHGTNSTESSHSPTI
jgi:hypothetical protein